MLVPTELLVTRHANSVPNAANAASRIGDDSHFTPEYRAVADSEHPLTELGQEQARAAGGLILRDFGTFDNYFVSPFNRAVQTANLLEIPGAKWIIDPRLAERDWGVLSSMPYSERELTYPGEDRKRRRNPLSWRPPGDSGETTLEMKKRVQEFFESRRGELEGKRTLVVGHGEMMLAVRAWLTGMSDGEFAKLMASGYVSNTEMHHYTNTEPTTGDLAPSLSWTRTIAPTQPDLNRDWAKFPSRNR